MAIPLAVKSLANMFPIIAIPLLLASPARASYAFYVGKSLTADGSVMVGGTGEEVSSHWLEIFPAKDHAYNATMTVGVTEDAVLPGELIEIPQVNHTFRYLSMEYSDFEGFPAPLTNGGLNEYGVAVRDVWAETRTELWDMTPTPQRGLQYSDLARVVLERATSARQGVEIIGDMMAKYGYADYGGNSHLIADKDEGWLVWEFAGGQGLWAAERLGPDVVRVLYPGYIEDFPIDYATNGTDYLGSPNLVSFAVEQGWWDPNGTEPFNIFNVYGLQGENYTARDGGFKYMSQGALENATLAMVPLTEEKLMERVRDFRISDDEAGYGQVVSLREDIDADLLRIWVAPTGSVTAPFNPWWLGVRSVPSEYGQHRYLTKGSPSSFLNPDFQLQEASQFAGRIFKQLLYFTCSAPDTYLPIVQKTLNGLENSSRSSINMIEKSASLLISSGDRASAQELLTFFSHTRASEALIVGRTLVDSLGTYIKLTGQWRNPVGTAINDAGEGAETVNCLVGLDPDQPIWNQLTNPIKRRSSQLKARRSTQEEL
ncbi:peptidase family C69-domain-containing protein [Pseudomassariella vexata]|uniref:Peptidase family C69-domain-containing protein n=1 Tax=Pseudomassariella vexata TaxID=1141098 RepID=A0A1Y2DQ68_9PEZI|nr:peptidase family C69-domain-containing protein [Pseudomassariella vexata]ORY61400.1 peptidase family C69-domain-containing protein [Pseudomassariella vexata]